MSVNKVVFGGETIVDLTNDTVTPETLKKGVTAHNRAGEQIVGTAESDITVEVVDEILYVRCAYTASVVDDVLLVRRSD